MSAAGSVIRTFPAPAMIAHLRSSHSMLLSGGSDGYLRTHDLRLGPRADHDTSESSVLAHVGGISGLEVSGNCAVTIGWGMRYCIIKCSLCFCITVLMPLTNRQSRPHPDSLVKLFDLRTMRPLPPLPFSSGPAFINTHSKQSNTVTVTSAQGLVHSVDITRPTDSGEFYQVNDSKHKHSSTDVSFLD
jgi:PAB-dependent poly(A)-specific ribonuclease subunit 2